jgi:hypothetical protein
MRFSILITAIYNGKHALLAPPLIASSITSSMMRGCCTSSELRIPVPKSFQTGYVDRRSRLS